MGKLIKNNFSNFLAISLIVLMLAVWVFGDWPRIWPFGEPLKNKILTPPKIEEARATSGDVILLWDTNNGSVPGGWTCISCTPGDQFMDLNGDGVYPVASSSYGSSTEGIENHNHTLTYSSATQGANGTALGENTSNKALLNTHTHTWGAITAGSGNNEPPYKSLNIIYANNPSTLPANIIGIFDTDSLPTNWTRYSALDSNYLRGFTDASTGGSATHTHTVSASAVTSGNATKLLTDSGSNGSACNDQNHTLPASNTNLTNANNAPAYLEVVFAYNSSGGSVSIPNGLIAFFNATPTGNWNTISGASPWLNSFLKGATTYGGTGGSSALHNHGGSVVLTSDACGSSLTTLGTTGSYTGAGTSHTHDVTYTVNNNVSTPVHRGVIVAKYTAVNAVPTVALNYFPDDGAVGGNITLIEGTTTQVSVSATITDTDTYSDIKSAKAYVLRHSLDCGSSGCSALEDVTSCSDYNENCLAKVECQLDTGSGSGNNINCTASPSLYWFATPTGTGASAASDDWMVMVIASDAAGAGAGGNYNDGVVSNSGSLTDVNTLSAIDVSSSVNFGTLLPQANTGSSPIGSGVENTGNKHIDVLIRSSSSSYALWCDNCLEPDTIANNQEVYSSASIPYSDDFVVALTGTNAEYNICLPKATNENNRINDTLFWGLAIPSGQGVGIYTGQNTLTATGGDTSNSAQQVRDRAGTECIE